MTSTMNHWERVRAAIKGEEVDRVPISLWRHWPVEDETPEGLAMAMVRWQKKYDFDLVKFMPTGTYGAHDWGVETVYNPGFRGNRLVTKTAINAPDEWPKLPALDPHAGALGQEVEAIRIAAKELDNSVPILQTVFSPLTTAVKLAGEAAYAHLRLHSDLFKEGLRIITDTTIAFTKACLEAGAHGVFFATQNGSYRLLNDAEFQEFGVPYDVEILEAIAADTELNMLHAHGEDIMFTRLSTYPVELINWHDRYTWPSIKQALDLFDGLLVAGIDDRKLIAEGSPDDIRAQVRDAVTQANRRRLMVGPGCVIPTNTPDANVRAAVETVQEMAS